MKKHLGYWAFSAMLVAALTACGKKDEAPAAAAPAAAASAPAPVAAEEKVLNVYNWPDYVAKDMTPTAAALMGSSTANTPASLAGMVLRPVIQSHTVQTLAASE